MNKSLILLIGALAGSGGALNGAVAVGVGVGVGGVAVGQTTAVADRTTTTTTTTTTQAQPKPDEAPPEFSLNAFEGGEEALSPGESAWILARSNLITGATLGDQPGISEQSFALASLIYKADRNEAITLLRDLFVTSPNIEGKVYALMGLKKLGMNEEYGSLYSQLDPNARVNTLVGGKFYAVSVDTFFKSFDRNPDTFVVPAFPTSKIYATAAPVQQDVSTSSSSTTTTTTVYTDTSPVIYTSPYIYYHTSPFVYINWRTHWYRPHYPRPRPPIIYHPGRPPVFHPRPPSPGVRPPLPGPGIRPPGPGIRPPVNRPPHQRPPQVRPPSGGQRPPSVRPPSGGQRPPQVRPPSGGQRPPQVRPPSGGQRPPQVRPPSGGQRPPQVRPPQGGGAPSRPSMTRPTPAPRPEMTRPTPAQRPQMTRPAPVQRPQMSRPAPANPMPRPQPRR